MGADLLRLCREDEIAEAASRGFDPLGEGRDTMFVVRHQDQLYGWRNACPHYDFARMNWRKDAFLDADGTRIVCAAHGALFMPDTGTCILGPCLGQSLTPVPLTLRGGDVLIDADYRPGLRPPRV